MYNGKITLSSYTTVIFEKLHVRVAAHLYRSPPNSSVPGELVNNHGGSVVETRIPASSSSVIHGHRRKQRELNCPSIDL